jgi:two-component system, OmpR family, sensor histidine kinase BaeS
VSGTGSGSAVIERRVLSPLGLRLAAAFVTVAVAAVAVLAALTLVSTRTEVDDLVRRVHAADAAATAAEAGRAYEAAGGWSGAALQGVAAVAARGQASVVVRDADGGVVAAPVEEAAEMMARMHGVEMMGMRRGEPTSVPVVVDGVEVGSVELRFPVSHLPGAERQVRDAMARNVVLGGLLAVAAAMAVAVFVARRVSRPIEALTAAAARIEAGERDVRADLTEAPGELGALAAAFDRMSAAVHREDELRRRLVHDVAHEVRTPLTILRATTEGLVDGVLPADDATLHGLHDEVLRLTRLVGDLETLAAAEAATLTLRAEEVDLAEVARAAVDLTQPAAEAVGSSIDHDLGPATVTGDPERLAQIALNLLANALRHTPPGTRITVRTGTASGRAHLEVLDDGPGLDDADLPHLFDRFYRGESAGGTGGSGIGLSVAAELAAAHSGRITAANAVGGGAVFRLELPATT